VIKLLSDKIPIRFLCNYFSISPSSYYAWLSGPSIEHLKTKNIIVSAIKEIFYTSKKTYGSPRIYHELVLRGYKVSVNTVAKYMNELQLDANYKKRFKVQTTDSAHSDPIAPRIVKTEVKETLPSKSGEILAGDITYLRIGSEFIYLAVVIDLFNREVVGWSMGNSLATQIVLDALDMAMKKVGSDAEIIFHSDRGSQYASVAYRNFLNNQNITP
jgi:putative transposase